MKNKIRKTVGWCWNHLQVYHSCLWTNPDTSKGGWTSGSFTTPIKFPVLNRICSGWFNTRQTMVNLCSRLQTGSDIVENAHMWPQGGCRWRFDITNVTNAVTRYKLYWCTLKCSDRGAYTSEFLENFQTPFIQGAPNNYGSGFPGVQANDPFGSYWGFFDQSTRLPQSGANPQVPLGLDRSHARSTVSSDDLKGGGTYFAPLPSAYSEMVYGVGEANTNYLEYVPQDYKNVIDADLMMDEKLSFTFPRIRNKLRIRCVGKGVLPAYASRILKFKTRMPTELRPQSLKANNSDSFYAGVSGFFYVKAVTEPLAIKIPFSGQGGQTQASQNYTGYATGSPLPNGVLPTFEMYTRTPVALRVRVNQEFAVRSAFDSQPTFVVGYGGNPCRTVSGYANDSTRFDYNEGFYDDGVEIVNDSFNANMPHAPPTHPYVGPTGPPGVSVAGGGTVIV